MVHTYADIPDHVKAKPLYPLGEHLWRLYKKVGWEYLEKEAEATAEASETSLIYELMKHRLDETIRVAKSVIDGTIQEPENVLAFMLYPPTTTIRADLQQGVMKLIYGESCDVSFIGLSDIDGAILSILNAHCEDGIPVDWWVAGPDDELLERRHLKLGMKLRDIGTKSKTLKTSGTRIMQVLNDVRNERTPQWIQSSYHCALTYGCAATNMLCARTNYELWGIMWDGQGAKAIYGIREPLWEFIPAPPLIKTIVYLPRSAMVQKMVGLTHHGRLSILGIEDEIYSYFERVLPEIIEYVLETYQNSIRLPISVMECQPPNIKDKKVLKSEQWDWVYPGRPISPEDLGMTVDEMREGVYLDVDHTFPMDQKVDRSMIISTGLGRDTKFWR